MATRSNIEWTQMTWNPVTGCTKISAGCKNCYAERMAKRLQAIGVARYANAFKVTLQEDLLEAPLSWARPRLRFRQLDERLISRRCTHRIHRESLPNDG